MLNSRVIKLILITGLITLKAHAQIDFDNFSSNLPIIIIKTQGKSTQYDVKVKMGIEIIDKKSGRNSTNDSRTFIGDIDIKERGSASQLFPKKSYGFETVNFNNDINIDTSLLGFPREHDWILVAQYPDKTLLRNALTYKIVSEMGHYAPRIKLVEVFLDKDYRGVYLFTEKIKRDKKRVDIAKLTDLDIAGPELTGGYIIKIDRFSMDWKPGDGWYSNYKSTDNDSAYIYFQYNYPNPDSMPNSQKEYIKAYFDNFEKALKSSSFKDPLNGYRKYIDVPSFIDNMLINEVSKNVDAYRLSSYFYKDKDKKLKAGPIWDADLAWYNCIGGEDYHGWEYANNENNPYYIPFWWTRFNEDSQFKQDVYCRYKDLRKSTLSNENLLALVDSFTNVLSEAQVRNFERWPIMGDSVLYTPSPIPKNYEEEVDRVKEWIKDRLGWMDRNIYGKDNCPVIPPKINGIEEIIDENSITIYPNPFAQYFTLTYKSQVNIEIMFYDILGRQVFSSKIPESNGKEALIKIDTKTLPPGIYFLVGESEHLKFQKKLIKAQ